MERFSVNRLFLIIFYCTLMMATGCSSSSSSSQNNGPDTDLLSVVAISRHGIRSPTVSNTALNLYTQRPQGFPNWPAPANIIGNLSTVGQHNATLLGVWYRDYYASQCHSTPFLRWKIIVLPSFFISQLSARSGTILKSLSYFTRPLYMLPATS